MILDFQTKLVISLAFGGLALYDLVVPQSTVEPTTIVLVILAFVPWLFPFIKSVELPGGIKLELQELKNKLEQTEQKVEELHQRLGALSEKYETGGRDPGFVSSGIGEFGGVSYGSYGMTSQPDGGTVAHFLGDPGFPWRTRFAGLEPGSSEFTQQWQALAKEAPKAFSEAQHDYIKRMHYDPLIRKIKAKDGIDIENRSRTLRDVVWSVAVQHGGNTPLVNRALAQFQSAEAINPDDQTFDEKLIKAIYAERSRKKASGDLVHFATQSRPVQDSVLKRLDDELRDALEALKLEQRQAS